MAQPAEVVVKVSLDTADARRQVRHLRKAVRDADGALARLEVSLDAHLVALGEDLKAYGIRLEVES